MISDILAQAVDDLDYYLNDFDRTYTGELRHRIIRFRNEAEYLRSLLDVPPGVRLPSEAVLLERIEHSGLAGWKIAATCWRPKPKTSHGPLQRVPKPNARACCRQTVARS